MRVTVTELKRMIAESVAKHMKEQDVSLPVPASLGHHVPGRPEEFQTGGVGGKPQGMRKEANLKKMVREVIEEMMHKEQAASAPLTLEQLVAKAAMGTLTREEQAQLAQLMRSRTSAR